MSDNANALYTKQVEYLLSIYRKHKDNMNCIHKHIHSLKSEYNFKCKAYLTLIQHVIAHESNIDTLYAKESKLMCKQFTIINNDYTQSMLSVVHELSVLKQHYTLFKTLFEVMFIYDEHKTVNEHVKIYFANVNEMKTLFDIVAVKYKSTSTANTRACVVEKYKEVFDSNECQYECVFPFDVLFEFIRNAKTIGDVHMKRNAESVKLNALEHEKNNLFIQLKRIEHQIGLYKQLYKEKKKHLDSLKHIHNTYSRLSQCSNNIQLNTIEQVNHLIIQLTLTEQNIELLKSQLSTNEDIKSEYSLSSELHSLKSIVNCYQSRLVTVDDNSSEDKGERNVISSYKYIDVIKKEKTNEDEGNDDDEEEHQFEFDGSICDEKYNKDEDAVNNNNNNTLLCKSSVKYRSMGGTVLEQTTQQFNITRPRTTYKTDCIKNSIFPVVVPQTTAPNEAHGCCNSISYCATNCI